MIDGTIYRMWNFTARQGELSVNIFYFGQNIVKYSICEKKYMDEILGIFFLFQNF